MQSTTDLFNKFNVTPYLTILFNRLVALNYHDVILDLIILALIVLGLTIIFAILFRLARYWHHKKEPAIFLEITPPQTTDVSPVATAQLFNLISGLLDRSSWIDKLLLRQSSCSFEIVSQKENGIRFILRVPEHMSLPLEKNLRSYLPGIKIKETADYLPDDWAKNRNAGVFEFQLNKHFSWPLNEQTDLENHDPLAYLTGAMTQLKNDEILAIQIILRPLNGLDQHSVRREINKIQAAIRHNKFAELNNDTAIEQVTYSMIKVLESIVHVVMIPLIFVADFVTGNPPLPPESASARIVTPADKEREEMVKAKIYQPLFEITVRTLLVTENDLLPARVKGLMTSFMSFDHLSGQSIAPKWSLPLSFIRWFQLKQFALRLSGTPLYLTASEIGALYHFPFKTDSYAEDLTRVRSRELPAPLVMKNNKDLDVVFGQNGYGNAMTLIGLTDDDRSRHVYLIGQTGSGKSTIIYHMAADDIKKGRGLAIIDPHGDLGGDLLKTVPKERFDDVIYFNPYDIKYPVGINLLELTPNLDDDELELEKELVCESVISVFRRVFGKEEDADAHRIEYILRNTIYTAFSIEDCTIFTVYDLLNNPDFRKQTIKKLTDEDLKMFWQNEFGKAGNLQIIKMVGGVTSKIGRFLFSPITKRILEQPHSTINFDDIMNSGKVLICNLAEGKLGENTSKLLGTTIIAKIQQATMRRARAEMYSRKPFYLFIDEFQNFATNSFTKLLSGGRKFGLRITIAEQSTAQQSDRNTVNVILANTGTVICFRTASPIDEDLMLSQFSPAVSKGEIGNLPRYHFYIKLSAGEPQEPFSGETFPVPEFKDSDRLEHLIEASRKNYTIKYVKQNKVVSAEKAPSAEPKKDTVKAVKPQPNKPESKKQTAIKPDGFLPSRRG